MLEIAPQILRHLNRSVRSRLTASRTASPLALPFPRPKNGTNAPLTHTNLPLDEETQTAIARARDCLFDLLHPKGFWEGRVYDNVTITAEYVMFLRFLGLLDAQTAEKAKRTILDDQLPDGGWNIYGGGPSEHSATVEAYFGLKLCGLTHRHKTLQSARDLILAKGGIDTTRVFTKINLALFGQVPWNKVPVIQPELMLLPKKAPIHIYEFSSWSRAVIIPLLLIFDRKPVVALPKAQQVPELYAPNAPKKKGFPFRKIVRERRVDLEQIFDVAHVALSMYEFVMPIKPLRKRALNLAEKWVLEHQDKDGSWCGIFPAMANSILALHLRGYSFHHPVMKKGLRVLRSYAEEDEETLRMQSTQSPIWDTGIAAYAFWETGGLPPGTRSARCLDWLLDRQILDVQGDWKHKARPGRPGGWPFEHHNAHYPDIDDTALAILALLPAEEEKGRSEITHSIDRGVEWLIAMQGSDGGWGAFDRDNNRHFLNQIPFADLKSLLDPSTPDVTGHVIEALAAAGYHRRLEPIRHGFEFLRKTQESDGSWFGRWGVNYVYGTAAALSGLWVAGEDMNADYVKKAGDWLAAVQNPDGGFGESVESYEKGSYVALGRSTASQTAWGLIGLLACECKRPEAIERAARWLMQVQKNDGSWDEPEWTGTGFPRHFYLRYDYYRLYFPLWALGRYARWKCGAKSLFSARSQPA
ncbi:MAG TPA: squalene--hopene cyclase [Bdellovibrionota bacterium]|nr:squalene--hopene cyclase [Bdellovibrionota bacterium]